MFGVIIPVSKNELFDSLLSTINSLKYSTIKPDCIEIYFDGSENLYSKFLELNKKNTFNLNIYCHLSSTSVGLSEILSMFNNDSKYTYFARVDCGDIVFKKRFEKQLNLIKNNQNIFCVAGNMVYSIETIRQYRLLMKTKFDQNKLFYKNTITHSSILINSSIYLKLGGYDKNLSSSQDYDLYRRALKSDYNILFVNDLIGIKYFSLNGTTFSKPKKQLLNTLKIYLVYFNYRTFIFKQILYIFYYFFLFLFPEFIIIYLKKIKHVN